MPQLKELFSRQKQLREKLEKSPEESEEEHLLLAFWIGSVRFATPIERVREIIESIPVTALPLPDELYEGVLNLRGNLIPVLSHRVILKTDAASGKSGSNLRHVVLETHNHELFAIQVTRVSKVAVPRNLLNMQSEHLDEVVAVNGEPVHFLNFFSPGGQKLFLQRTAEI